MLLEIFSHSNPLLIGMLLILVIYFGVNISKKGNINIKYKDINPSYDINLLNPSKWPGLI